MSKDFLHHPMYINFYFPALIASIVIVDPDNRQDLNEHDTREIVGKGLQNAIAKAKKQNVTPESFLIEADKVAGQHFRMPMQEYAVVLSMNSRPTTRPVGIYDSKVKYITNRQKSHPFPESIYSYNDLVEGVRISGHHYFSISVKARSTHEAVHCATERFNLLRSLWTLITTFRGWHKSVGHTSARRLGVIHLGPLTTVHHMNGKPATHLVYQELSASFNLPQYEPHKGWGEPEKFRRWAMRKISRHSFRTEIQALLIRYVISLDQVDQDTAFLQLWGVLERLTDTVGSKYDETARRGAWFHENRKLGQELLNAIRLERNRMVHAASYNSERDQIIYLLKWFVETHLLVLIRNDFRVNNLKEYAEMLSLTTDVNSLAANRRRADKALRILRKRSEQINDGN